jgi:amino acid adenylation domain-containing protein
VTGDHVSGATGSQHDVPDLSREARRRRALGGLLSAHAERDRLLPLSFAQQRMWFLDRLHPGTAFYNIHVALRLGFAVDERLLARCLDDIVTRHESLRTWFAEVDGEPLQAVLPATDPRAHVALPLVDVAQISSGPGAVGTGRTPEQVVAQLATEQARRPFDLTRGPLLRAALFRLRPTDHVLAVTVHHAVADGWSMRVFFSELATLYAAFGAGRGSPLPDLPVQYGDYTLWQRDHLAGARLDEQIAFWRERLDHAPLTELPPDRPRPAVQSFIGATHTFRLPTQLTDRLRGLAASSGATLFMAMATGFAELIHRWTGQTDLVVGAPVAGRTRVELEPLIGFFVNTVVLRLQLDDDATFAEALRGVRHQCLGAFAHQDLPFEKLVEALAPPRDLSRNPLCQIAFQHFADPNLPVPTVSAPDGVDGASRNGHGPGPAAGSVDAPSSALHVDRGTAVFDLVVTCWDEPDPGSPGAPGIAGRVEFNTDLYDPATIDRLIGQYIRLLDRATAQPDSALSTLDLCDADERAVLARHANGPTPAAEPTDVLTLVREHVDGSPGTPAVVTDASSWTYAELAGAVNRLARHLHQQGIGPGSTVAVHVRRDQHLVSALLALLTVGATYLPLDLSYPPQRLTDVLDDARPDHILTTSDLPDLTSALRDPARPSVHLLDRLDLSGHQDTALQVEHSPELPAYVIYTSGSTGRPKGVVVPRRALANVAAEQQRLFGVGSGDRVLQFASPGFDASIFEIIMALGSGATLCMGAPEAMEPGRSLTRFLRRHGVTVVTLTPTVLASLDPDDLPDLTTLTVAGEACPAHLVDRWAARGDRAMFNLYGPTETTIWATAARCTPGTGRPPIGRPIAGASCLVVDPDLKIVPVGVVGELLIGGVGVATGYLGRPDLTAQRFIPDPTGAPGLVYRSGDLVRWRGDGELVFVGRVDDQVKLHGVRIEPGEIEAALREDPGVQDAVVTISDGSEDGRRLVAHVVPAVERSADQATDHADTVTDHVEQLARWRALYDDMYAHVDRAVADGAEPWFDPVGWNSSVTGAPIPLEQMRAWADTTADRALALRPRTVLDVGCGTGLLISRIAPAVGRCVGTDLSAKGLDRLRHHLDVAGLTNVELRHCSADDPQQYEPGTFDLVVLNSVVQYFPDADYLGDVLTLAWRALAPGGSVLVGDVRNLALLDAVELCVEAHRAPTGLPLSTLAERADRRRMAEEELVVHPSLFRLMADRLPGPAALAVRPKSGSYDNELSRYRYDVLLTATDPHGQHEPRRADDAEASASGLAEVGTLLRAATADHLLITGLLNRRVSSDRAAARLVEAARTGQGDPTVADLLAAMQPTTGERQGVEPDDLVRLGAELGWHVDVQLAADGWGLDVLAHRTSPAGPGEPRAATCWPLSGAAPDGVDWAELANDPLRGGRRQRLVGQLRHRLESRLPESMLPSAYVLLDQLPRQPSGKVDRRALPQPDTGRPDVGAPYVAPRSGAECALTEIWKEVLGLESVGVDDDFFQLGGHSLLATQAVARTCDTFDVDLSLQLLFERRTISAVAVEIERLLREKVSGLSDEDVLRLASESDGSSAGEAMP